MPHAPVGTAPEESEYQPDDCPDRHGEQGDDDVPAEPLRQKGRPGPENVDRVRRRHRVVALPRSNRRKSCTVIMTRTK